MRKFFLALLLATVMPCHRIGWSLGADKLTVVSVGTGSYRARLNARDLRRGSSVTIALRALMQQPRVTIHPTKSCPFPGLTSMTLLGRIA